MTEGYYGREGSIHTDGTPLFQEPGDRKREAEVSELLSSAWSCDVHPFGVLAPLDYFATRHGRLSAVIEIKCRSHNETAFETVFLNLRKWLALGLAQVGMGVPAFFVVQFRNSVRYARWDEIDARNFSIGGCSDIVKSHSDIEPLIEVSVPDMTPVRIRVVD